MDEQEKLFNENISLSYYAANRFKQNAFEHDDIVQMAMIGLWKACKTYKPEKNCKFTTYALRVIKNELLQAMRSVRVRDYTKDYSLDQMYEDTGISLAETIADDFDLQDEVEKKEIASKIISLFSILKENERKCVELYYLKGYKQIEIAEMLNLTQANISRIVTKAMRKIKGRYLSKYGGGDENTSRLHGLRNNSRQR